MTTKTASDSLEKRLQTNPDSLAFSRLAEQYRTSGDIARAIELCVRGNEKHPEYVTGRIVLGRCYADIDNFDDAVEAFESVCRLDRHNMAAMKMLADIFIRRGAREKAGDLYALLAAMDPWNETLSRMASQTPGSKDAAEIHAIPGPAPKGKKMEPPVMEIAPVAEADAAARKAVTQEVTQAELGITEPPVMENAPVAEADAAARKAVTQEIAQAELGITEVESGEKDEAVLENVGKQCGGRYPFRIHDRNGE